MDSHANVLVLLGLPADGLHGSPPILADYLISDVGRDVDRADSLIAGLAGGASEAQFYGNLYVLEPLAASVRLRHLYDEARTAELSYREVTDALKRWRALITA